jgi:transcriptional regulator, tetR family
MAVVETEKISAKARILHAAAKLFLKNGYYNSSLKMIAKEADSNTGSLGWAFKLKEEILCELVGYVFDKQFDTAEELLKGVTDDKVLFYAVEATLQLYMAEQNEQVREMYNVSYSFTDSAKIIYNKMSEKLQEIFKEYLPHLKAKDFYEREIASAGIMRNFITVPCDRYFEMERKIKAFLETTFLVYNVPKEKIEEAIAFVSKFDMQKIAKDTLNSLLEYIDKKIDEKGK